MHFIGPLDDKIERLRISKQSNFRRKVFKINTKISCTASSSFLIFSFEEKTSFLCQVINFVSFLVLVHQYLTHICFLLYSISVGLYTEDQNSHRKLNMVSETFFLHLWQLYLHLLINTRIKTRTFYFCNREV